VRKHRRPRWAVLLALASTGFLSGCYYYPYGYYPYGYYPGAYPYPQPYAWGSPYPPGAYPPPAPSNPATPAPGSPEPLEPQIQPTPLPPPS
jgi:hypothetical protein